MWARLCTKSASKFDKIIITNNKVSFEPFLDDTKIETNVELTGRLHLAGDSFESRLTLAPQAVRYIDAGGSVGTRGIVTIIDL